MENEVLRENVRECKGLAGEGRDRWEMEQRKQLELRLKGKERRGEDRVQKRIQVLVNRALKTKIKEEINETFEQNPCWIVGG